MVYGCLDILFYSSNTVQPVLSKDLRDIKAVPALDRCLLKIGLLQCICLFGEMKLGLPNTVA